MEIFSSKRYSQTTSSQSFGAHHHLIDRLAVLNGFVSGLALYPQVVMTFVGRETTGLSAITFLIIAANSMIWLLYAYHRNLLALGIASTLNAIAGIGMAIAIYLF